MSKDGDSVFSRFKPAPNKPPIDLPGGYKLNFRKKKWRFGKFLRVGVPLFGSVIIGTYFLFKVMQGRYEYSDKHRGQISVAESKALGKRMEKEPFDLEKEYEKMQSQINLVNWESKRISRPGEPTKKE